MGTVVFLPSPLLGPRVWREVADRFRAEGTAVRVARLSGARATVSTVQADLAGALPLDGQAVIVAHSNAGLYVPGLVATDRVQAAVYVDAAVPRGPGSGALPVELVEMLAGLADADGLLPPWSEWWDEEEVAALFPSDTVRREVESEQARVPLRYFESSVPVPAGWESAPAAFLAFGATYAEEVEVAQGLGWPVRSLPGGHLHMLRDPDGVTAAITALLAELGVSLA